MAVHWIGQAASTGTVKGHFTTAESQIYMYMVSEVN